MSFRLFYIFYNELFEIEIKAHKSSNEAFIWNEVLLLFGIVPKSLRLIPNVKESSLH